MSNELINEFVPANLSEGETIIPENFDVDAVKDIVEQYIANVDQQEEEPKPVVVDDIAPVAEVEVAKPAKVETKKKTKEPVASEQDIVAVFSTKNVTWSGVGKVYRGYNIVSQEEADKWVTRDHIRLATPQEVAKEYGL